MAFRPQESEVNDLNNPCENSEQKPSIPLSVYANKLEEKVKKRYVEKISAIGIDPVLIEGKNFEPDCLPPVESTDLLFYLVLETSYYTKQQFKAFRSLQAYNQMVSGFISSVQGHIINDKFVVLAKVRHSQRMNDALIPVWIITERQGTIISAHCCGCKAGLGESCSHVASVLFYLEAWTKINGKLSSIRRRDGFFLRRIKWLLLRRALCKKSCEIPTVNDLSDPQYQDLKYPELLEVCSKQEIELSDNEITQIEKDTRTQSQGANFFKHRAGRIGASQSKQASHTDPALPSQSLIQSICYPGLNKLFCKAIQHGCEHEAQAISAFEEVMKEQHINFKIVKCGVFINNNTGYTPGYMQPQTFSVLVTVAEKDAEKSNVLCVLKIVTLRTMF